MPKHHIIVFILSIWTTLAVAKTGASAPPMYYQATEMHNHSDILTLSGHPSLLFGGLFVMADTIAIDIANKSIIATGHVEFYKNQQYISAKSIEYHWESGFIQGADITLEFANKPKKYINFGITTQNTGAEFPKELYLYEHHRFLYLEDLRQKAYFLKTQYQFASQNNSNSLDTTLDSKENIKKQYAKLLQNYVQTYYAPSPLVKAGANPKVVYPRLWAYFSQNSYADVSNQVNNETNSNTYTALHSDLLDTSVASYVFIHADSLSSTTKGFYLLKQGTVSSCHACRNTGEVKGAGVKIWEIQSKELAIITKAESLEFTDLILRLGSVPALYIPAASLSYSNKRKSGFLGATLTNNAVGNTVWQIPYYQALGNSAEATVSYGYISSHGTKYDIQQNTQWTENTYSHVGFSYFNDQSYMGFNKQPRIEGSINANYALGPLSSVKTNIGITNSFDLAYDLWRLTNINNSGGNTSSIAPPRFMLQSVYGEFMDANTHADWFLNLQSSRYIDRMDYFSSNPWLYNWSYTKMPSVYASYRLDHGVFSWQGNLQAGVFQQPYSSGYNNFAFSVPNAMQNTNTNGNSITRLQWNSVSRLYLPNNKYVNAYIENNNTLVGYSNPISTNPSVYVIHNTPSPQDMVFPNTAQWTVMPKITGYIGMPLQAQYANNWLADINPYTKVIVAPKPIVSNPQSNIFANTNQVLYASDIQIPQNSQELGISYALHVPLSLPDQEKQVQTSNYNHYGLVDMTRLTALDHINLLTIQPDMINTIIKQLVTQNIFDQWADAELEHQISVPTSIQTTWDPLHYDVAVVWSPTLPQYMQNYNAMLNLPNPLDYEHDTMGQSVQQTIDIQTNPLWPVNLHLDTTYSPLWQVFSQTNQNIATDVFKQKLGIYYGYSTSYIANPYVANTTSSLLNIRQQNFGSYYQPMSWLKFNFDQTQNLNVNNQVTNTIGDGSTYGNQFTMSFINLQNCFNISLSRRKIMGYSEANALYLASVSFQILGQSATINNVGANYLNKLSTPIPVP
jgi:hypothetical protein